MANMIEDKSTAKEIAAAPKARKRKGVDKWKTKKWFTVLAPPAFNNTPLAQTPGEDPENVMNRIVNVSGREVTGNIKKTQLMLKFRVNNVQGLNAYTVFDSIEVQPGSVRRLVRRRSSKIEAVDDVMCKDGVLARVKTVALCAHKVSGPRRATIRTMVHDEIKTLAGAHDYEVLLNQIVTGDHGNMILSKIRKIAPMKRVDVLKVVRLSKK